MSEYDQTFDPNILIGHCDLISRFSDFALYLDTCQRAGLVDGDICSTLPVDSYKDKRTPVII